eukprot:143917-Pyramimonas_sp.AAC.1
MSAIARKKKGRGEAQIPSKKARGPRRRQRRGRAQGGVLALEAKTQRGGVALHALQLALRQGGEVEPHLL